jgi:hypothetical protein
MKSLSISLLFVLFACNATWAQTNPLPFLNQPLVPSSTPPGGNGLALTVHGAGFMSRSVVNWNGNPMATTFVSVDELTATVPASNIAVATSAAITVTNPAPGGGTSNVVYFAVSAPTTLQFTTSPSSTSLPLYYGLSGAVAADLTRNGKLDLAISTYVPALRATTYGWTALGNGDGTFQGLVQTSFSAGLVPVIGDFNKDGKPDLVVTACGQNPNATLICQLLVYLGNGDGTFSQSAAILEDSLYLFSEPVIGDFNGDGKLDVAVAYGDSTNRNGIMVFFGNGDGTLQSGVLSTISDIADLGVVGDFDGDGKLDLVGTIITNPTNGQFELIFFHGNGDGTFTPSSTSYPLTGQTLAADLNADGKLDLILLRSQSTLTVMLGNGNGTFQPQVDYSIGASIVNIVLGDFSANGKLDLALSNNSSTLIIPGKGDGTFDLANVVTVPALSDYLVAGDFNNDGKLDLALAYKAPGAGVAEVVSYLLQEAPLAGFSQSSLTFAAQPLGTTSSLQSVTLTNNGTGPLNLSNVAIIGTNSGDFPLTNACPSALAVGVNCQISVSFAPTANGPRSASLSVTDNAPGTPQIIPLSGSGGLAAVQLSPSTLSFGNEPAGNTSASQSITISNTGYSTLNISSISVTGANGADFSETATCGSTLAAGANCTINVTFTPAALGNRTAAVTITDDAPGSPQSASLTGSGISTVGLSPSSITFSSQYVGTSGLPKSVMVTNNGVTPLTISAIAFSPSDFGSLSACGSSVAPGASCSVGVFFDPTAAGARTGTLTLTDNAFGSPQTVTLSGMGQDFSVAASSSSTATVTSGQTANYTVAIAPGGGFTQTVSLSCSGAPASSTCSLSSNSVALNGSTPASVTVAVTTAGSSSGLVRPFRFLTASNVQVIWLSAAGFAALVLLSISLGLARKPIPLFRGLAVTGLLLLATVLSSCGGGGSGYHGGGGTPAGTYTLTITGTFASPSTTLTRVTKLTLVVQ